jgi:hypothetical protein
MRHISFVLSLAMFAAYWAPLLAQDKPQKPAGSAVSSTADSAKGFAAAPDNSTANRQAASGLTSAREAAAMAFIKQHHPELVDLLVYLKQNQPAAYEQAVLDLFRASERLAQQKEVNYDRYELDLALWKVESRIELVAARLKMAGRDSPEGEKLVPQLRKLLEERHDLRAERLLHERQKITERIERIDRQLETMSANREQAVERELTRFVDPAPVRQPQKNVKSPR